MFKPFDVTVLPGGRKVRDYSSLTVDALKEAVSTEEEKEVALEAELAKPKPRKGVTEALAEDESLG